jgi:hypothetical protein
MLPELLAASVLLALCVVIHAAGLTAVFRRFTGAAPSHGLGFLAGAWLLIRVAWWLIIIHLIQIAVGAMFYFFMRCLPDLETALYFSVVTYTTVGYGDVVLGKEWRLLAGVEALTGILMCGLSTGFFFAVLSAMRARLFAANDVSHSPPS